ncbi:hypothetical protein QBC38DRAFT_507972 [Podospora fimiseda]|uniref:Uncharacterized protein n=1 Tax=Podospora fimiseda TaxID=252190 RepID=A0AAN7BUI3_9PEZI|nr:hypothetical protein QBC38DRAFT_507972 [Podospora fimiseda]
MNTDANVIVESPLVEDFLDCDKLGSDSDSETASTEPASPKRALKRLRIHVDMASTQYLRPGVHHHHHLSGSNCGSGPSSVSYSSPELDPYSAVCIHESPSLHFFTADHQIQQQASGVSSFNYPAAADSSLLTPVSSAASPPLQSRASSVKPMRNYHQTAVPGPQVPTPPNSSKMYYSGYEVNTSSQGSSPMTVHPAVTESGHFDMSYMAAHSPPTSHHPSSPKSDVPPPIDPYLGHFTVSGTNGEEVTHHSFQDYHTFNVEVAPPQAYLGQHPPHHMHHRMPSNGGHPPVLAQPHPSHFRANTTPRIGGIEDLRDPSVLLGGYPSHPALSPGRRPQQRKKPTPARKPARTPKSTPQIGSEGQNALDDGDKEELTLRDDAPEDDKYLFQLRKEFISEKGKGMWEEMKAKYSEKHQGNWEKAALQMKVSRAVAKFGVWPKQEIERLKEAHRYFEEKRYQFILTRMKENGGCRVWDWKPQHIEAMLVKLGMEEPTVDEKSGSRRRKNKVASRRRAGSQNTHHHSNIMGDWSKGLGLHHAGIHGHPGNMSSRQASFDMDDISVAPTFSSEQENEYLDHIFNNKQVKMDGSLSPEVMELSYDDESSQSNIREPNQQRSERVARQACEQMIQTRVPEHTYVSL